MGRNSSRGSYFNLSFRKTCGTQAESLTETGAGTVCASAATNLNVNFRGDWSDFLQQKGMAACGLKYDQSLTLEENTMRYLNAHDRRIPINIPRTIHESRELSIPQEYAADYLALKTLISSGRDLKPYLSRDILKKKRPDYNDGLLNAWGIQHLHFRSQGTDHVLLCKITDADVFVIQALPHVHDVWVDTSLLQILHDNWPEEIAAGKCLGVEGESMAANERLALRSQNANFATTMSDGTVYLAPGGGLMASGDCFDDRTNCDKIFEELAYWERIVLDNSARFRAALNWPPSDELSIKMMFVDRECWLCEPTTGRMLSLTLQE